MSAAEHGANGNINTQSFEILFKYLIADYLGDFMSSRKIVSHDSASIKQAVENLFVIERTTIDDPRNSLGAIRYCISFPEMEKKWNILFGPTNDLFAANMKQARENYLKKEPIEGIITLKNTIARLTFPTSVIVLGSRRIKSTWLTSATSIDDLVHIFSDITTYQRRVYYTSHLDPKSFMPEFYNDAQKHLNEIIDKYGSQKVVRLEDIAEIILGKSVQREEFCEDGFFYLRGRDIQNGVICNPNTYVAESYVQKYAKQLLQEGDILLSKNFGQHKIAQVTSKNLPAMASNGLFIIRPVNVPEDYLFQYMTSNTGKEVFDKQLTQIETGTTIRSITLTGLRGIIVPLFDEQTMLELSKTDEMSIETAIHMLTKTTQSSTPSDLKQFRSAVESRVYDEFLNSGWNEADILIGNAAGSLQLQEGKFTPDIVLQNGKVWIAIVEVKSDLTLMSPHWIQQVQEVIKKKIVPFFILSTGFYHEIHSTQTGSVKKLNKVPSKEFLLSMLDAKEVD